MNAALTSRRSRRALPENGFSFGRASRKPRRVARSNSQRTVERANQPAAAQAISDEIVRLAQRGDAAAFETIYRTHCRRVYALCLRMIGDPVEAEDLTQEAFMQLFRKIHTFRGESAFSSWLHRLTANIVLMRFRKKRPVFASLDEMTRDHGDNDRVAFEIGVPDLHLTGVPDRLKLTDALEQLPGGYKLMFTLHDVHGYEHNEIAVIMGCSVGNSKSQLHKARKRLRELLGHRPAFAAGASESLSPSY
jgi:RNA polymerase sigma-70 factor, ECF subfamily